MINVLGTGNFLSKASIGHKAASKLTTGIDIIQTMLILKALYVVPPPGLRTQVTSVFRLIAIKIPFLAKSVSTFIEQPHVLLPCWSTLKLKVCSTYIETKLCAIHLRFRNRCDNYFNAVMYHIQLWLTVLFNMHVFHIWDNF